MSSSSRSSVPEPTAPPDADRIDVVVPARAEFASTVRTVAASLAADAGFSVDEIDDVRLGLSEVFAAFADVVDGDARLRVSFLASSGRLAATAATEDGAVIIEFDELASSILDSVVDECISDQDGVRLVKYAVEIIDHRPQGGSSSSAGTG